MEVSQLFKYNPSCFLGDICSDTGDSWMGSGNWQMSKLGMKIGNKNSRSISPYSMCLAAACGLRTFLLSYDNKFPKNFHKKSESEES